MKRRLPLFWTGWLQVLLVGLNTWQYAHEKWAGVFLTGVAISMVWSFNVKRIAFGNWADRLVYSLGAGTGGICGLLLAKLIY